MAHESSRLVYRKSKNKDAGYVFSHSPHLFAGGEGAPFLRANGSPGGPLPADIAPVRLGKTLPPAGLSSIRRRSDINADVVHDALYGPNCHVLLVPYKDASLTGEYIEAVVNAVFDGLAQ
ncbi:hypothetical protein [Oceanidesulfovibrio marinus]|uniref:hypothetical protein n=1 Tax=Oceanidesulfovibrio marinus TaxID=370038 RepID=UPI001186162C|nr:hypothetical protein [Oceanidesulfovibrio marinus]